MLPNNLAAGNGGQTSGQPLQHFRLGAARRNAMRGN
jgi:hypothetical protein